MENLKIEGSHGVYFVPNVDFNATTGVCEISGEAYLADTVTFFEPLIKWLRQYMQEVRKPLTFNIKLMYFNTSSSKSLFDILMLLRKYKVEQGGKIEINWYYNEQDLDMEESIEDYVAVVALDINQHPIQNQ